MVREIVPILRDTKSFTALYWGANLSINSRLTGYLFISANLPSTDFSTTFPSFFVTVRVTSETTLALFAGSITNTLSPATFCTFTHSLVWSCPISTTSKPGTRLATSIEASSTTCPNTLPDFPAWNNPTMTSGFSFSFIIFTHLRAQGSISSKCRPLHNFSGNHEGMAGVIIPRTAILTPSRSNTS